VAGEKAAGTMIPLSANAAQFLGWHGDGIACGEASVPQGSDAAGGE
jgi:hypothetical protein